MVTSQSASTCTQTYPLYPGRQTAHALYSHAKQAAATAAALHVFVEGFYILLYYIFLFNVRGGTGRLMVEQQYPFMLRYNKLNILQPSKLQIYLMEQQMHRINPSQ